MLDRGLREILIRRKGIGDRTRRKLSVKTKFRIDVSIEVKAETISHAHVLRVRQRRQPGGRVRFGPPEYSVKAQAEIATESERAKLQHALFEFLDSIFGRILGCRIGCRGGGGFRRRSDCARR